VTAPGGVWRRFLALPAAERRETVLAAAAIPVVWLLVRLLGFGSTRRLMERGARPADDLRQPAAGIDGVVRSVDRAAGRLGPLSTCLTRSLVLWWRLRRHGHPAVLRAGVRRAEAGIEAHAWVELGGSVLNDVADVAERFTPFDRPLAAGP
jgi:hypothetical protein